METNTSNLTIFGTDQYTDYLTYDKNEKKKIKATAIIETGEFLELSKLHDQSNMVMIPLKLTQRCTSVSKAIYISGVIIKSLLDKYARMLTAEEHYNMEKRLRHIYLLIKETTKTIAPH